MHKSYLMRRADRHRRQNENDRTEAEVSAEMTEQERIAAELAGIDPDEGA